MSEVAAAPLLAIVREDPFDPNPPQLVSVRPGETIADLVDRLGFDPIARDFAVAVIDGEEIAPEDWAGFRLTDGCHVSICIAPQGGDDGNKALTTVLTIFVMVASFWVSGGALGPALGNAFIKNTIGANLAGMAVAAVGTLAISALVKPPTGPQQDRINPVYAIDGATNRFAPFEPILLTLGRRRVFPRLAARGFQELVGDDFYYRLVVDWGPIGVALSDIKVGDTPIGAIDGVEMQHRLVESDPHPTLYPAQVFQEEVGATLINQFDWEMRRTIPDATEASVIIGFPTGLGHTTKKGASESWGAQVEIRYRRVTGDPGDETFGAWQSPPGNGVSSSRGSFTAGPGKYGWLEKKRNQPFFRQVRFALPEAGLYEVEVRRSSENRAPEVTRTLDDMTFALIESRRPGRPVTREDVAYSVFRFKGTDETSGRIETINGILDRLVPRFDAAFLASGDLSTAGPEHLTAPALSSNMWEQILWLYRNGFEGRRPLTDAEIDWPSFAIAAKNAADEGWTFDHVFEGAATIADPVEAAAFAGCGRAGFMGNRLTAVVDAPQLAPVAVLSDRKVRNVRAVKRLSRPPDGFRVRFDDAADGYRTREVIVYTGGHTAETASLFETMQVPGIVNWGPLHRIVARNYRNSRLQNRTITAEVLIDDIDAAIRRGAWIGIQTKVVEVGRAAGWIRRVETNGSGDVTAVILDQGVSQTTGDDLVLQWNRQMGEGVSETLSNALPVASPAEDTVSERIEFETPVSGANKPQAGDHYVFGLSGFLRLDCLVDEIEAIDHEWLRLHLVNYAPERFDETGFVLPDYTPAFERPAFIRPPELELVALRQEQGSVVIHFRPKPGERGTAAGFIAARALAPAAEDDGGAYGAWDPLPDMPASARQMIAPGGQAGEIFRYRIAALSPTGEVGPYLIVDEVAAIETLAEPQDVTAEGVTEPGAGGSERPVLIVSWEPDEDVALTELVIELRRVALNLSDERLDEEDQPPFEAALAASPAAGRAVIRGLPAGARLDVEVFFRGANQAVSPRVRVADVMLPETDVAGKAADLVIGGALQAYIDAAAGSSIDEYARGQAADALAAANNAFAEAESVRSDFEAADEALETAIAARATLTQLSTVESDAEAARVLLGNQITSAFQAADAGLQGQIDNRATITQLNTAIADEASARTTALAAQEAAFQSADTNLQGQIDTRATISYVDASVAAETSARADAILSMEASFRALAASTGPVNFADRAYFQSARAGSPLAAGTASGTEVNSAGLGRALRTTWTSAGHNTLTKAIWPIVAGRIYRVRLRYRVQALPPDGTANLTAIIAGIDAPGGYTNPASIFQPSWSRSNTDPHTVEFTIGDNTSVADAAWPGSGSTHFRVGLRQGAAEETTVDLASIEVEDATADRANATEIAARATITQLNTVEANANAAISALNSSLSAEIDGVAGDVDILSGVLAQPSGSEAIIAFRANTSSGVASLQVISTSGSLGSGTKIQLTADLVNINGLAVAPGTVTADRLNVSQLSAINANVGLLRTASSGARMEMEANQLRAYDTSGVLRVRLGVW